MRTKTAVAARPRPRRPAAEAPPPGGLIVGTLAGFGPGGEPLVQFPGSPDAAPLRARAATPLAPADRGARVVLGFEGGDLNCPMVIGRLWEPAAAAEPQPAPRPNAAAVRADGERVVISADREIVLQCGEASITLTRAGKVLLRGTYLSSRSSGVNRIKGGSVQIN